MQKVHLKRTKRLLDGHLWVFSNELYESPKKYDPGSIVEIYDMKDAFLGMGYINPKSLIAVRILTKGREIIDREFLRKRIERALDYRERFCGAGEGMRLVFSEGDFLPGLIVDKYGSCLAIQFLTLGMENLKEILITLLDEMFSPETIVIRNDSRIRELEGLSLYKDVVKGSIEKLPVINEDGVLFEINPLEGQKTGFFLDQRENRISLKHYIKEGKGLDLFCYSGAWSLHLASVGAEVTGIDESGKAIEMAQKNAALNKLQNKASFIKDNVFTFLREKSEAGNEKYDFIVLDPPAFVKSASKIKEAVKAYRELNALCMGLLKKGGILASSSCSYHMGREMFLDMLNSSARDAGKTLRLISLRSQGCDHPVLLSMPETEYLKCAFLVVD